MRRSLAPSIPLSGLKMVAFLAITPMALVYSAIWSDCRLLNRGFRILLIGAGGASRGVLLPLLSLDCAVTITNRTFSRAEELAALFAHTGSVAAVALEDLAGHEFDLVINATSSGINGEIPAIPASLGSFPHLRL